MTTTDIHTTVAENGGHGQRRRDQAVTPVGNLTLPIPHPSFPWLAQSKARTLAALAGQLRNATVPPLEIVPLGEWLRQPGQTLAALKARNWPLMAVRSSAAQEDAADGSMAGAFLTRLHVRPQELADACAEVVWSMTEHPGSHEFFVQPMVEDVVMAGVAFTCDPNGGGPYHVVNYSEGHRTDAVTGGDGDGLRTCYIHHAAHTMPARLEGVAALLRELGELFPDSPLDVEFAVRRDGSVVLLQVRPLVLRVPQPNPDEHAAWVERIAAKVAGGQTRHPFLFGQRTVYGVMPDWNPAEIIGVRPRPLALSLYKDLVTDAIWAYQRDNYGYRNLRSFPLLQNFQGVPFIDVRVSFNSFLPKDLPDELAERLTDHYLTTLVEHPAWHDKVEFDIVFSCYSFDLPERLERLRAAGFAQAEIDTLADCLRRLTHRIIHHGQGLWRQDRAKLDVLAERRRTILDSDLDAPHKIYWLLEDCKRYGTLPFAGLARAGFIAVQLLRSLVDVGIFTEAERNQFMRSLETVSGEMGRDFRRLSKAAFLERYGHLRPGTYDITSPRYDAAPDLYFDWSSQNDHPPEPAEPFCLSLEQFRRIERLMAQHGLDDSLLGLFDFLKAAIEGREYAKFVFTANLSDALELFAQWGAEQDFDREALSFADIGTVARLVGGADDARDLLARSIASGRERYARTGSIVLPPLVTTPDEVWSFHLPTTAPNFITQKRVSAPIALTDAGREALRDRIVLIPAADPGYDWLFTCGIAGFITQYGGINSHMAIRAQELGLPAVIGCGEAHYQTWSRAHRLQIDCVGRQVTVLM
ncbi:PEP/pyruvate-binding domain-containing protein [Azospirillum isscasi]|uniref:PEP/pyruvate-binding domain-containing protein n=1 Tax=Azospirillum isscasi TaxID=3053926 RepID=A0ABU0WJG0_9PROT|nr:PEP/pyruvate-binding domain-containing protein [Azospirillum isscasi]MDQ2104237.1 PEP/pyruvate-binding domain-containing protein [Azospirillum isscasi]